jgi:predicted phosphodiesterase
MAWDDSKMRVFALSDIHIAYYANAEWIANLSLLDYQDDVLVLAGDVTDDPGALERCLYALTKRFKKVLFVPGNHDLWVLREGHAINSLEKFQDVCAVVEASGASMRPCRERDVSIIPLLAWYDYSFGQPSEQLLSTWMDYRACRWPSGFTAPDISAHFASLNREPPKSGGGKVITYSHFVPRLDLMPKFIPGRHKFLYPILGSAHLERQLRTLKPFIHIYGHSHVNRHVTVDAISYVNNAFGYPSETWTAKRLECVYEC